MKLPRDLYGRDLAKRLAAYGYEVSHQTGSHIRLTTQQYGEHHLTVPDHRPLRVGTLNSLVREIALHTGETREQVVRRLFG